FLVTEPAAASPLPELLQQRGLVPLEAAALTARLARAVQAFHDQGAVHGQFAPDWVLVRGDLDPLLCPCGVPGLAPQERAAARPGGVRVAYGLLALLPCTLVLGYVHARSLVHRLRLRHRGRLRTPLLRSGTLTRLIQLGPFALLAAAVAWYCAVEAGGRWTAA